MTATGTPAIIESLLLARAALMETQGPTLPVSMPDAAFTKPADGKYLEVKHLPNRHKWESLASDGPIVAQGILQVLIHWPKMQGSIPAQNISGKVMEHFSRATKLYGTGIVVTIPRAPWPTSPIIDTDTIVPVSIPYQAVAG